MTASIELADCTSTELAPLRARHLSRLPYPMDGMWESFARMAQQIEIRIDGEPAGFGCVNDEGLLLQFSIVDSWHELAQAAFEILVDSKQVRGSLVSTGDPALLGPSLDRMQSARLHSILFDDEGVELPPDAGHEDCVLTPVLPEELENTARLQRQSLDHDPGDWLLGYLDNLVRREELFALRRDGTVLATGELRVSDSQPPHVDLGVITMRAHRRKGAATSVLSRLRRLARERELRAICSTTVDNLASRKAITRAGFRPRHRLLEIRFRGLVSR